MKPSISRYLLLIGIPVLARTPAVSLGPAVTVEVSRTYCLVRFVEMLAGSNSGHAGSRREFQTSCWCY